MDIHVPKPKYGDFKAVTGQTGVTIYMMKPEGGADLQLSTELLSRANLRLYTYQEILPILMKDKSLLDELKGETFYLAGTGLRSAEDICTVDDKGELAEIRKVYIPHNLRVQTWAGEKPLFLDVVPDELLAAFAARFNLNAQEEPFLKYSVVLGTPLISETVKPGPATESLLSDVEEQEEHLVEGDISNHNLMRRVIDV